MKVLLTAALAVALLFCGCAAQKQDEGNAGEGIWQTQQEEKDGASSFNGMGSGGAPSRLWDMTGNQSGREDGAQPDFGGMPDNRSRMENGTVPRFGNRTGNRSGMRPNDWNGTHEFGRRMQN